MVATVVKPLLQLRQTAYTPASLSVFTDARLLRLRLLDEPLPFSDNVLYIFDQQIEEADLLVVNKIDLLPIQAQQEVIELAKQCYPTKKIIGQNSLAPGGVNTWLDSIENRLSLCSIASLSIDYQRYGMGEAQLAWLDQTLVLSVSSSHARITIIEAIENILSTLKERKAAIGHIKFLISDGSNAGIKLSFTTLETPDWIERLPSLQSGETRLTINARVEMEAVTLQQVINACFEQAVKKHGGSLCIEQSETFHPRFPQPTYRISNSS